MADLNGYDANEFEPAGNFEAIPAGWYPAVIVESERKPTKAAKESGDPADGEYLNLTLQIIDGQYKNRTVFDLLNLWNRSEQAVAIAKGTLSSICRAVGRMTPKESEELHNIPLQIKLTQEPYNGEMKNKVKGYKPMEEAAEAEAPPASKPAPAKRETATAKTGTGGGKKAPWAK